jgi:hypothetical protein
MLMAGGDFSVDSFKLCDIAGQCAQSGGSDGGDHFGNMPVKAKTKVATQTILVKIPASL